MQNYQNHRRINVLHHLILAPLLVFHLIYTIVRLFQEPGLDRAESVLPALVLLAILIVARLYALKLQDRLIRLEEQVRYARILPKDLAFQAENLPLNQILALRFAADAELPALITRALRGETQKPDEIKRSVINWRADELRV